jgi:hypothetical protein
MTIENNCDVCQGESGGEYVGVASIPGAPMSIAWCNKCLAIDAVPWFILKHDFIYVAAGHLENLAEWALDALHVGRWPLRSVCRVCQALHA